MLLMLGALVVAAAVVVQYIWRDTDLPAALRHRATVRDPTPRSAS